MRPWIMHVCHSDATWHIGVTRTLQMLEWVYLWIGMDISTRWWMRRCLKLQPLNTSSRTAR